MANLNIFISKNEGNSPKIHPKKNHFLKNIHQDAKIRQKKTPDTPPPLNNGTVHHCDKSQ